MWKRVWILSALALVLGIPVGGHAADEERMQQLEQQLQAMQNAMSSMQGELESLRAEQKQEQEREAEQTRRQNVLAEEVDKLRTSLTLPDFQPLTMEDSSIWPGTGGLQDLWRGAGLVDRRLRRGLLPQGCER